MLKEWRFTNGDFDIPMCKTCKQPIYSGHSDCTCDKNHPENCDRPTYEELLRVGQHDDFDPFTPAERFEHQRKVAGDNMEFALKYRTVLQNLLERNDAEGDEFLITILSAVDVEEITEALEFRTD
jgi:hypothetical protein